MHQPLPEMPMNSPQQSVASFSSAAPYGVTGADAATAEDVPLGCECADPALQIDCWGAEADGADLERD
jgi:hypothetical protein